VPYGDAGSEKLDIFGARGVRGAPVLVYIHGGYWRALDKADQSFVATPFVKAGGVVVLPNYALAPVVSVRHIVLQMVQALVWVQRNISAHGGNPKHIVVAGHSAGGHLAAMMLACQWPAVAADLPAQLLRAALSISGVFDVEPLRHAPFLAPDLQLTAAEARALSPALMAAPRRGRLLAVVGADESPEFQRQNRLIRQAWGPRVVPVCEAVPGRNHMDVLNALAEPGSRLHALAMGLLFGGPATED
jgi:arylformamidase